MVSTIVLYTKKSRLDADLGSGRESVEIRVATYQRGLVDELEEGEDKGEDADSI